MDPDFWHRRWEKNEIGFHEGRANAMLEKHWPSLAMERGAVVFVPLCGKAVDMARLAADGHRVRGVELSAIAARDFFREHGLAPATTRRGEYEVYSAGGIEIWVGDAFALTPGDLGDVAAVYDRAALVALPAALQQRYVEMMVSCVPSAAPILLVTFDYDQSEAAGPPFATPRARVNELYAGSHTITELDSRPVLELNPNLKARGLTWLHEHVLRLDRRAPGPGR